MEDTQFDNKNLMLHKKVTVAMFWLAPVTFPSKEVVDKNKIVFHDIL